MKGNEKNGTGSWLSLVLCGVLPAVVGLALAMVLAAVAGCEKRAEVPERWIGIDRSRARCTTKSHDAYQATCVSAGRVYRCVYDSGAWECGAFSGGDGGPVEAEPK